MKHDSVNYFAVGLFVLAGLGVLLYALYHLVGGAGAYDVYYTRYANVAGLSRGTQVTYEGYGIGSVSAIEPQRDTEGLRYRVEMRVPKGWRIPADSVTQIYAESLLADYVLDIKDGQAQQFLRPGATLASRPGGDLFAVLGALAGELEEISASQLRPLLQSLNQTVQGVGGDLQTRLPVLLATLQSLVDKLDDGASHLSTVLNAQTASQARRVLNNVDGATADLQTLGASLLGLGAQARELMAKVDALVDTTKPDLAQAAGDLRRALQALAHYSDSIVQNIDETARNASEFSRQIRENPRRLLSAPLPTDPGGRRE